LTADFVFVSGNKKKVEYLEEFLGTRVEHHELDLTEIQSVDPMEVVEHKAREAFRILGRRVLIEDTAVWFHAMGRLPGPFIKFFIHEVGLEKMCRMLDFTKDRSATASVVYGLFDGREFVAFGAEVNGVVPNKPKGNFGMGWDPIFIPKGQTETYAQMERSTYRTYSVRNTAVQKLRNFLETSPRHKKGEL
jgi:non-canonical purine NTP pyrophosphatase (RdgB/HAM1 family)